MLISAAIVVATILVIVLTVRDSLVRRPELDSLQPSRRLPRSRQDLTAMPSIRGHGLSAVQLRQETRSLVLFGWLALGLILVVIGQSGLVPPPASTGSLLIWLAGLMLFALLDWKSERSLLTIGSPAVPSTISPAFPLRLRLALVVLSSVLGFFLWREVPSRGADDRSLDLVIVWLVSMAAITVAGAGGLGSTSLQERVSSVKSHWPLVVTVGALALFAGFIRFANLDSYPLALSGDEGTFAVAARQTTEGALVNPFSSGPWGYPSLLSNMQGWFILAFGDTVAASRMLSAAFGLGSVVAIYFLVKLHFGKWTALSAGILTATFHLHVFWSRDAQNAAAPMFFVPLALLFLDRGIIGGHRKSTIAAGFTIAFGQYFHPADRILIPVAIAYVAFALIPERPWRASSVKNKVAAVAPEALWLALAFVVGFLPLGAYFLANPTAFWSRTDEVSVFASGWLEREKVITGKNAIEIMWIQTRNAIMLPFNTVATGHMRPLPPLSGWFMAVPVAIGLALSTAFFWTRRYFPFAMLFWVGTIGIAFTDGPPQTNRYTLVIPFLPILAAVGIAAVARISVVLLALPKRPVIAAGLIATLLFAGWHLDYYFHDPNQVELYSDANSQVAHFLAREIEATGEDLTVHFAGSPRLSYGGFSSIAYIAPNGTGYDIATPLTAASPKIEIEGPTLFAFIPERAAELEFVQAWYPDGERTDHLDSDGLPLFVSYLVEPQ